MILAFFKYCYFWTDILGVFTKTFEPAPPPPPPRIFSYGVSPLGSAISTISQDTWFKNSNFAMADVAVFNPADQSDFQTAIGAPLKANGIFKDIYQIDNNLYPQKT